MTDEVEARRIFEQIRSALMVVWPFVGIPWCVPACLGLVQVLDLRNLLHLAEGRTRPDLDPIADREIGKQVMERTYASVQNGEVREMLQKYFSDFSATTWMVVLATRLRERRPRASSKSIRRS